jgi:hypothetical protein
MTMTTITRPTAGVTESTSTCSETSRRAASRSGVLDARTGRQLRARGRRTPTRSTPSTSLSVRAPD